MQSVLDDREVWRLNLELLPPQPSRKAGEQEKKKKKELSKRTTSKFICFLDKYGIYNILGNFTSLKII